MLWDIIRDFIVQYITGGTNSDGELFDIFGGRLYFHTDGFMEPDEVGLTSVYYQINNSPDGMPYYLGLPDWLATTITAVIMILLVVFAVWLVRWIFKAVSSAFLLK